MNRKNIQVVLVTMLFAILLWGSVNMSYQYQTTITAPLTIQNIPRGMAIKSQVPPNLQLRFRGDGWQLAGLYLGTDIGFVIDLQGQPPPQNVYTLADVTERLRLPAGAQPVGMKPDSITIELGRYATATVPVVPHLSIFFREDFGQVGPVVVQPESVTVGGEESVVRRITSWQTQHTVLRDVKAPVDMRVRLAESELYHLQFTPRDVVVRLRVEPFAEKTFAGIPVEVLSVPPNREIVLRPPRVELVARGGIEQLAVMSVADFRAVVHYESILSDTTGVIGFEVSAPNGIQVVQRRPEFLQYIIRKRL